MKKLIALHSRHIYLKPGEIVVAYEPTLISSVLGSCVAVTMFSPERRIGAICHAMLPYGGGRSDDLRYVDSAIQHIYQKIRAYGVTDLVVKMFGGAQVLEVGSYAPEKKTVGAQNVLQAELELEALGLKISAQDTGGIHGRKIYFCTREGDVFLHRMGRK